MNVQSRRTFLRYLGACAASLMSSPLMAANRAPNNPVQKNIPSSQEALTVIGMGTWQTFNVGSDPQLRAQRTQIVELFFQMGGQIIDSSPMYGSSQQVIGHALDLLDYPSQLFSAEKVWTRDGSATRRQIQQTAEAWGVDRFDLMQIHNLLSWEDHIEVLAEMKRSGEIRYVGITTSHGRRHGDLEQIMASQPLDFVQITYNMEDREVEQRLLPLAQERGIAVIANRPFKGGALINRLQRKNAPLPDFAKDVDCNNWAQFLLKYVVSHPAITCAIPATTRLEHLRENMGAATGSLPDEPMRNAMLTYLRSL